MKLDVVAAAQLVVPGPGNGWSRWSTSGPDAAVRPCHDGCAAPRCRATRWGAIHTGRPSPTGPLGPGSRIVAARHSDSSMGGLAVPIIESGYPIPRRNQTPVGGGQAPDGDATGRSRHERLHIATGPR